MHAAATRALRARGFDEAAIAVLLDPPASRSRRWPDELEPPAGVRWLVLLPREVVSELFTRFGLVEHASARAAAGSYEVIVYPHGLLSVIGQDGMPLGIKPGEYLWATRFRDLPEVVRLAFGREGERCARCERRRPHGHPTPELEAAIRLEVAAGATDAELAGMLGWDAGAPPAATFEAFTAGVLAKVAEGLGLIEQLGPLDVGTLTPADADADERVVTRHVAVTRAVIALTRWRLIRRWMTPAGEGPATWKRIAQDDDGLHWVLGGGHTIGGFHRWTDADFLVAGPGIGDELAAQLTEALLLLPPAAAVPAPRLEVAAPLTAADLGQRIADVHARHAAVNADLARILASVAEVPKLPEVQRAIMALVGVVRRVLDADIDAETVLIGCLMLDAEDRAKAAALDAQRGAL